VGGADRAEDAGREGIMPRRDPNEPPKKRGRKPKILARRENPGYGIVDMGVPDREITDIKATLAAARMKVSECPVCAKVESTRMRIENDLVSLSSSRGMTKQGDTTIKQLAVRWKISEEGLLAHRDQCMKRSAVMLLEKKGAGDIDNSAAWISKLTKYLEVVDGVIAREGMQIEPDPRVMLAAADEGRKICETNARLFLDLWKLRVDVKVQDDFMRIVLEVINQVAPAAKEKIVEKIKARLAMATAGGAHAGSWL